MNYVNHKEFYDHFEIIKLFLEFEKISKNIEKHLLIYWGEIMKFVYKIQNPSLYTIYINHLKDINNSFNNLFHSFKEINSSLNRNIKEIKEIQNNPEIPNVYNNVLKDIIGISKNISFLDIKNGLLKTLDKSVKDIKTKLNTEFFQNSKIYNKIGKFESITSKNSDNYLDLIEQIEKMNLLINSKRFKIISNLSV